MKGHYRTAILLLWIAIASVSLAQNNDGYEHRTHSVPRPDQTVYDIDDNGFETIHLDGIGSHSHNFEAGPPVLNGVIVQCRWREVAANRVFCTAMECDEDFPVGKTQIQLTVVDNTGDTVSDTLIVPVLPRSALTQTPRIDSVTPNPNQGQAMGENIVTIEGAFLYRDTLVLFGTQEALSVEHVNLNRIICKAPGGTGTATVTLQSSFGTSNGVQYIYQEGRNIPIRFLFDTWKNQDGSEYFIEEITSIAIGRDHRYYMGSLLGHVTVVYVDRSLIVQTACTGAFMGTDRSVTGIVYNPLDPMREFPLRQTRTSMLARKRDGTMLKLKV